MHKILFIIVILSSTTYGADIRPKNRVHNDPIGVCWWTCADMIGREKEINRLIGIKEKVIHNGYGAAGGASNESIIYWISKLQLKMQQTHTKNEKFLTQNIDKDLPIITHMSQWEKTKGHHAILLLEVTREKKHWTGGDGKQHNDYIITYIDPNNPHQKRTQTWTVFWKYWTGNAYAFDPNENK